MVHHSGRVKSGARFETVRYRRVIRKVTTHHRICISGKRFGDSHRALVAA